MASEPTSERYTQILSAILVSQVRTARALSILLSDEELNTHTRQELRTSIGLSVNMLAIELDRIRPGGGDHLLKLYVDGVEVPEA